MIRRTLCLLAALSAWLSTASAGQTQYFASSQEYVTTFAESATPTDIEFSVQRWMGLPSKLSAVTITWTEDANGYTAIENPTPWAWSGTTYWEVGWSYTMHHAGSSDVFATPPGRNWAWSCSTTSEMGMEYMPQYVGPPKPYDGMADGLGASGRSWQIRYPRTRTITLTSGLAPWCSGDAQGKHRFVMHIDPYTQMFGDMPPGHWRSDTDSWARYYDVKVTYTWTN